MIPDLEAALLRYEAGVAKMKDFKKEYTAVKNKMKQIEKYLVTADEETKNYLELSILNYLRYAENKFILIDKKLNHFKQQKQNPCKKSVQLLKGSKAMDRNITQWHIQRVSVHLQNVNSLLLHEVADLLRIAKGHLAKVDYMKKSMAQFRRRRGWI